MLISVQAHRFILEHVPKESSPVRLVCIPVNLVLFIFKLYATCLCSVLSLIFSFCQT